MPQPSIDFYLIRHGIREDFVNPAWKLTAKEPNDTPLSDEGLLQATDIAKALETSLIQAIYCSPFLRTIQTAAPLAAQLAIPVFLEPGFGEWLNPAFFPTLPVLLPINEVTTICPQIDLCYFPAHIISGWEADETIEVRMRVTNTIHQILAQNPGKSFAAIMHGSPLCQLAGALLGSLEGVDTRMGAITRISYDGETFTLISSDSTHLQKEDTHIRFN